MHKLRINPLALQDLIGIKEYIVSSYEKLKDFPTMGVSLNSKIGIPTDYRLLVSEEYIIFYKIEGEYISVYRILNARRDYLRILFSHEEFLQD